MWRRYMQTITTIAAVIIVIAGIALGFAVGEAEDSFFSFLLTCAVVIIIGFISIGTIGMIAEGVEHLENIEFYLRNGSNPPNNMSQPVNTAPGASNINPPTSVSNAKGRSILEASNTQNHSDWRCSQCGEKNTASSVFCKYCGSHK